MDNHRFEESMEEGLNCNDETWFQARCAVGAIRRNIPLAAAIVGDQVRTHGEIVHAGGWNRDHFVYCDYESVQARESGHLEQLGIHPRCVQHWGHEGLGRFQHN